MFLLMEITTLSQLTSARQALRQYKGDQALQCYLFLIFWATMPACRIIQQCPSIAICLDYFQIIEGGRIWPCDFGGQPYIVSHRARIFLASKPTTMKLSIYIFISSPVFGCAKLCVRKPVAAGESLIPTLHRDRNQSSPLFSASWCIESPVITSICLWDSIIISPVCLALPWHFAFFLR